MTTSIQSTSLHYREGNSDKVYHAAVEPKDDGYIVTIPPNHEIPETGNVVECQYLHCFRESGSIYQPVYLGKRSDIPAAECTTDQLKYKADTA